MVLKTIFLALLLYLILANRKTKRPIALDRFLQSLLNKVGKNKIIHRIELLIKSSAVDKLMPFFNLYMFLFLSILFVLVIGVFSYTVMKSIVVSGGVGLLAGFTPMLILELLRIINIRRVRSTYHGFLCSLIGFFSLSGDVVGAYMNAADYTGEPLKSYVKDAVYKYNRSNINFEVCLDELAERANEREFIKLVKFTKLYLSYGGDYSAILNKINTQSQRLESARLSLFSSAYVGIIAIGVMIFIDFTAFFSLFTSDTAATEILGTTLVGNGLIFLNMASVIFSIYIIFRLFRGDI